MVFPLSFRARKSVGLSVTLSPNEVALDFFGFERDVPNEGNITPEGLSDNSGTFQQIDVLRARIAQGVLQVTFANGVQFNGWTSLNVGVDGWGTATSVLWEAGSLRYRTLTNGAGLAEYLRDNAGPFHVSFSEG